MKKTRLAAFPLLLAALFLLLPSPSPAGELAGVTMPDTREIGGQACSLVGMGIRTKFIIKVYVAGLFMEKPSRDAAEVVASDQSKGLYIQAIGPTMSAAKVKGALKDGFEANTPAPSPDLAKKMEEVQALFTEEVKKGDTFSFVYAPGVGTTISVKEEVKGVIPGDDLMRAVFAIWFGEKPADKGLKKGVLGE